MPDGLGVSSPWLRERRWRSGVRIRESLSSEIRLTRAERPAMRVRCCGLGVNTHLHFADEMMRITSRAYTQDAGQLGGAQN